MTTIHLLNTNTQLTMAKPLIPLQNALIENLTTAQTDGFSVRTFQDSCVHFHWHLHPEVELTYIREGQGILYAGGSVTPFAAGDLCLLGSGLAHAYGSDPRERLGARWSVMHFLPALWGDAFWGMSRNRAVHDLLNLSRRGLCFSGSAAERCSILLNSLEQEAGQRSGMSKWMEIMECLVESRDMRIIGHEDFSEVNSIEVDPRLRKTMRWIDENAGSDTITQAAAAGLVRMSASAFCRFFRQHTGKTFRDYVNEVRIARACSNLTNSDANISEIAFHTGFGNLSNFNRQFRRIIGRTPGEYRKMTLGLNRRPG